MANFLTSRLRRVTSGGRFIPEIDGLRFVAIGTVVVFHMAGFLTAKSTLVPDWSAALADKGHYGVHLFFAISGFILGMPFAAHYLEGAPKVNLKAYFLRRLTRLEPPYMVALLICTALLVSVNHLAIRSLLPHLLAGVFYLHNAIYRVHNPINTVVWSLEIEVQFYCLVPLLARLFDIHKKSERRAAIVSVAALAVCAQVAGLMRSPLDLTIFNYLQYFLMGFLLADIYISEWKESPAKSRVWDGVSVFAWAALLAASFSPLPMALMPPAILLAYCAAFRGKISSQVFASPVVSTIGGMCYTIYLLHYFGISAIGRFTRGLLVSHYYWFNLLLQLAIITPVLLVASTIYFVLIEQPCMRRDWPQRLYAFLTNRADRVSGTGSVDRSTAQVAELPLDRVGSSHLANEESSSL